jgi:predicted TPR repeat methyltransferase
VPVDRSVRWGSKLPTGRPVDRHDLLVELAENRRVAHVGFVDDRLLTAKLAGGVWLHERIATAAVSLVGLDSSADGVAWARDRGYEVYEADAQDEDALRALELAPFDVIVAGEVIEHLDAPGAFLRAMHALAHSETLLVVTTPNAYRLANILVPVLGTELVHPDHTSWQSASTLRQLHARNGWQVERIRYYHTPIRRRGHGIANVGRALKTAVTKAMPHWSDGLVALARPTLPSANREPR